MVLPLSFPLHLALVLLVSSFNLVFGRPIDTVHTPITARASPSQSFNSSSLPFSSELYLIQSTSTQPMSVAYALLDFTFTISPTTWNRPTSDVSVNATNLPDWLSFNPSTLTFSGKPSTDQLGSTYIPIFATLNSDSSVVVEDGIVVVVRTGSGVQMGVGIASQLVPGNAALTSVLFNGAGQGVRVPNQWSFSMGFLSSTFKSTSSAPVRYSAFLKTGQNLPAWLKFDPSSIDLSGYTPAAPADASSSTTISIELCGSTVAGYADVCDSFNLEIASHAFVFHAAGGFGSTVLPRLNFTAEIGGGVSVPWTLFGAGATGGLMLDGYPVNASDIASLVVDTSSIPWLSYDQSTKLFTGSVPSSAVTDPYPSSSQKNPSSTLSVAVSLTDNFNDTLHLSLPITVFPSLFSTSAVLPILGAPGQALSADLSSYLHSPFSAPGPLLSVSYNPQAASDWLSFNSGTDLVSAAAIPRDLTYDTVQITVAAQDLVTSAVSHQTILLSIAPGNSASHDKARPHSSGLSTRAKITLIAVVSSLAGLVLICLLLSCCRKHIAKDRRIVDDRRTAEANGFEWDEKDKSATEYGQEQMFGVAYHTEKLVYGSAGVAPYGKKQVHPAPTLDQIFTGDGQLPATPSQRRTTAGRFRALVRKPIFGPKEGAAVDGSPATSGAGAESVKSSISRPMPMSEPGSPNSTLLDFSVAPRRLGYSRDDSSSMMTGSSIDDHGSAMTGSTINVPGSGSRASWESFDWQKNDAALGEDGTPRRRADSPSPPSIAASQALETSGSEGSFSSNDTHSTSSEAERATIATAERVGRATPTTRSQVSVASGSPPLDPTRPRLVPFKHSHSVSSSSTGGPRSVSHSAMAQVTPPLPALTTASSSLARAQMGVPVPLSPTDPEASFRLSNGMTYVPNMNTSDSTSPSSSAVFFASPAHSVSFLPRPTSVRSISPPPPAAARFINNSKPSIRSILSRGSDSHLRPTSPPLAESATTSKLARIPGDSKVVYANTTEAFSFRPDVVIEADKPIRGVLKALVEGQDGRPGKKGVVLKKLPVWLKFNKGLFDGVPKVGDEGRLNVRVIETFSGLGGQAERVVARFSIEVSAGSQIGRRATAIRKGVKSPTRPAYI